MLYLQIFFFFLKLNNRIARSLPTITLLTSIIVMHHRKRFSLCSCYMKHRTTTSNNINGIVAAHIKHAYDRPLASSPQRALPTRNWLLLYHGSAIRLGSIHVTPESAVIVPTRFIYSIVDILKRARAPDPNVPKGHCHTGRSTSCT